MQISATEMELLKRSEGFRSRVYLDVAGRPTIGYSHRLLHPESFPKGICE
jgi:GH24 family phage-related lysozyme (muramidase)